MRGMTRLVVAVNPENTNEAELKVPPDLGQAGVKNSLFRFHTLNQKFMPQTAEAWWSSPCVWVILLGPATF